MKTFVSALLLTLSLSIAKGQNNDVRITNLDSSMYNGKAVSFYATKNATTVKGKLTVNPSDTGSSQVVHLYKDTTNSWQNFGDGLVYVSTIDSVPNGVMHHEFTATLNEPNTARYVLKLMRYEGENSYVPLAKTVLLRVNIFSEKYVNGAQVSTCKVGDSVTFVIGYRTPYDTAANYNYTGIDSSAFRKVDEACSSYCRMYFKPSKAGTYVFKTVAGVYDIEVSPVVGVNIYGYDTLIVEAPTGIDETMNKKINVYPNPATDYINFDKNIEYKIYTVMGELVMEGDGASANVSGLKQGMYTIEISNTQDKSFTKFVKN